MESRSHYVVVGLFVLLLGAGAVLFAFWMGKFDQRKVRHVYYYTYMQESVSGLPQDGDVKYMGVKIGKVKEIYIDPSDPTYVRLTLELPATFIVREGMYTELKLAGITGIAYVEIVGGRPDAKIIEREKGKIPVIPSKPSALSKLSDSLPEVTVNVAEAFDRINRLLDGETIEKVQRTVANLERSTERLESLMSERNAEHLSTILANLAEASRHLNRLYETNDAVRLAARTLRTEGNATMVSIRRSAEAVEKLSLDLDRKVENGEWDLRTTLEPALAETRNLLRETRSLIYELQEDARMLRHSPRDLLFKESEPMPGPGERP
jgi:phospholipid/cholesterol/gamma-HCH transport system substrate-binding protein